MIRASIRRPVAVAMAYLAVGLLGVAAWRNIPIELLPDTELPRLTVTARWPGASPETVEAFLTSPLEGQIQQVRGVERVVSESYARYGTGEARIEVEFDRGVDMDFARLDLSERLAGMEDELPEGARPPTVEQYVPREFAEQAGAFLVYTFTGPYTLEALRERVDEVIAPELLQVDGVAEVEARGGRERVLEVEVDEPRAAALGLEVEEVARAVRDLDLVREAGAVRAGEIERTVTITSRALDVADIRTALLTTPGGRLIRVSDVARVRDTHEDPYMLYRVDGRPAVSFSVAKEVGTNTVRVADAVKARLEGVVSILPGGTRLILDRDESRDIRRQLSDLRYRALVAAAVIFVVLLLFLRSFRSAGIVFATILFSVLIALNFVYFGGFTLNVLTLMGLAMGFGLIVDNSIVVLENVYRRWQAGGDPGEAAERGAREVVLPILAATATTLIVFLPFVYLQGELRIYYVPLAIVVGLTLAASLFVAFTFIPALTARILDAGGAGSLARLERPRGGGGGGSEGPPVYVRFYSGLLGFTLRHPWLTVAVAVLSFAGSWHLFDEYVSRGVRWSAWWQERTYIDVRASLPRGADIDRTDELVRYFEGKIGAMPEVEKYTTRVYGEYGWIRVNFPDSLEHTQVPVAIKEQMVAYSHQFAGAEIRVYGYGPSFYGGGSSPPNYGITVLGYNYERVREIADDLGRRLRRFTRIREVDTNASGYWFDRDKEVEYVVRIDREAAARHDVTVAELAARIQRAVRARGREGRIKLGGEEVRFDVKLSGFRELDVHRLRELLIPTSGGTSVRLGDVITVEAREILARIRRENQQYERRVAYEFMGPRKLGDVYHDLVIDATHLPPGYELETSRTWRWSEEEKEQVYMVLAISLVLIYMVTAALFESLRQPLCVLLTVPMALIGVFLIFFYADASFTREAYIGVIMMGGIVVNNAILLVDNINRIRREGADAGPPPSAGAGEPAEPRTAPAAERRGSGEGAGAEAGLRDAILRGTLERVRPILMTTATTVLGLLPLVLFAESADANIWNALAYALIGGLLASTLFVLTTTPALYHLFERGRAREAAA